jgi:hypothetical protein
MAPASMNGNGTPVTRAELKEELARFKTELNSDIARAMNYVVERIGVQMDQLRADLTYQIANAAQVAAEEHRRVS